eukprot:scaffold13079_cov21-Tisochrysis_lutea.AAC.3
MARGKKVFSAIVVQFTPERTKCGTKHPGPCKCVAWTPCKHASDIAISTMCKHAYGTLHKLALDAKTVGQSATQA